MRRRRAEQRHHRIPDELLHRPAEPLQLGPQPRVKRRQQSPDVLRVHLLGPGGEPHQVREQHSHDLALLAGRRPSRRQRGPAFRAELRPSLVAVAARRANAHPQSLRPASLVIPGQGTRRDGALWGRQDCMQIPYSARLQRTGWKGLFQYRSAVTCAAGCRQVGHTVQCAGRIRGGTGTALSATLLLE